MDMDAQRELAKAARRILELEHALRSCREEAKTSSTPIVERVNAVLKDEPTGVSVFSAGDPQSPGDGSRPRLPSAGSVPGSGGEGFTASLPAPLGPIDLAEAHVRSAREMWIASDDLDAALDFIAEARKEIVELRSDGEWLRGRVKLADADAAKYAAERERLREVIKIGGAMYRAERACLGIPGGIDPDDALARRSAEATPHDGALTGDDYGITGPLTSSTFVSCYSDARDAKVGGTAADDVNALRVIVEEAFPEAGDFAWSVAVNELLKLWNRRERTPATTIRANALEEAATVADSVPVANLSPTYVAKDIAEKIRALTAPRRESAAEATTLSGSSSSGMTRGRSPSSRDAPTDEDKEK